jgi:hypothetical protein
MHARPWHQPTFTAADPWWKLLYQAHGTLVLNGHEHYCARFRPMNPAGQYDPRHGITQIGVTLGLAT